MIPVTQELINFLEKLSLEILDNLRSEGWMLLNEDDSITELSPSEAVKTLHSCSITIIKGNEIREIPKFFK